MGDAVGVKLQQVQKYETGANRMSASRIVTFAKALEVSVSTIIGDYEGKAKDGLDMWEDDMTLQMVSHFNELPGDIKE